MGCYFLLQGIFSTQGSNPHLLVSCCGRWILTTGPTGKPTPIFFLLDPLSLRATKWPRDVVTHTEYTTIRTSTEASVSWESPRTSHMKKWKYQNLWERWMVSGPEMKDIIITQASLNPKVPAHLISGPNYQVENFS